MSGLDPRHSANVMTDCGQIIDEEVKKRGRR